MAKTHKPNGFTLIELLTVIGIIGVLAAVAIPQYSTYRQKGYDALAKSDLRNAVTAEEAYYATNQQYVSCSDAACPGVLPGFLLSTTVTLKLEAVSGSGDPTFSGTSSSDAGTGKVFSYERELGFIQ